MTLDEQIAELLAQAAPLRLLPDDEAEESGLPGIIDRINALRAKQDGKLVVESLARTEGAEGDSDEPVKRGPGRPKKA